MPEIDRFYFEMYIHSDHTMFKALANHVLGSKATQSPPLGSWFGCIGSGSIIFGVFSETPFLKSA